MTRATFDEADFRAHVHVEVLTPADVEFSSARAAAVWNGDVARMPAAIIRPGTAADVAATIAYVRQHDLDLTVRGGGHSFAGHAVADGAVMIDLVRLNSIKVDSESRRVLCGGGATWAMLDAATAIHAVAVPGGFISHTGVAGLTLGGGLGWLTRYCGLSCDNLVAAQVVTADARVVRASGSENPDLLWALRGGGGNFGVVTTFEFAAHQLNPVANLGLFFWRAEDARPALRLARALVPSLSESYGAQVAGLSAPPAPFVPAEHQGTPGIAVLIANWGSAEEHAATVAPLRNLKPLFELVTPIPHAALQQMLDESAPWGIHAYEKSLYLDDLDDGVIDLLVERIPARVSPMSFVPIFALGGRFAHVPEMDTAYGGSRGARWALNIAAVAPTAEMLADDRAWARGLWAALRPHAKDSGGYINFLADAADEDRIRATYGPKYDRLARLKAAWDPDNVFHHNANIRPTP